MTPSAIPAAPAETPTVPLPSGAMSLGGMMSVIPNAVLIEREKAAAQARQSTPVIQALARHVRECWAEARKAKEAAVEPRIFMSLRQRRGEYEPEILADIKRQGGADIYMHLTSNKCRAASAWLRDVLAGTGGEKPWSIEATPVPDLPAEVAEALTQHSAKQLQDLEAAGVVPSQDELVELMTALKAEAMSSLKEEADECAALMSQKMEDQLLEGGWNKALSQFLDDITTLPSAFLKAPVVRKRPAMAWAKGPDGQYTLQTSESLCLEVERVDPLNIYPAPYALSVDDGYLIERHKLTRSDLNALDGVEGYDSQAIRAVLAEYGRGGLTEWLSVDAQKAALNGQAVTSASSTNVLIDALQYWGTVPGEALIDWGMDETQVPDVSKDYACEVWLIGSWVIKATLNSDPLGRKPYFKTAYEEVPGSFWGNSPCDLIRDLQNVCNASARSMVNNMGIASGPQVVYNVDRLPADEDLTAMYPWKIWQTTSDPYGNNSQAPVSFFQPNPMIDTLMAVYEKFSALADEYSGIPRYMAGEAPTGGVGRTASGISLLMGNATKAIKQVVANIDTHIFEPVLERYYFYNMRYGDDPALKGDVNIHARGALAVATKDSAQVRRNEFLQIIGSNPAIANIVGEEGLAAVLREVVKTLDMNPDKIVPSPEILKARKAAQAAMLAKAQVMEMAAAHGQMLQGGQPGAPTQAPANPAAGPSPSGQTLPGGAPVTDTFTPQAGV